jgi:hypothetical protein
MCTKVLYHNTEPVIAEIKLVRIGDKIGIGVVRIGTAGNAEIVLDSTAYATDKDTEFKLNHTGMPDERRCTTVLIDSKESWLQAYR